MRRCNDQCRQQPTQKDSREPDLEREYCQNDCVVCHQGEQFLLRVRAFLFHGIDHLFHRIEPPQGEQEREWQPEQVMLDLTERRILARVRCPRVQERVRRDVLVDALFVRQRMVLVVFVRPEHGCDAGRKWHPIPHLVTERVDAMDVVMSQPPRSREGNS